MSFQFICFTESYSVSFHLCAGRYTVVFAFFYRYSRKRQGYETSSQRETKTLYPPYVGRRYYLHQGTTRLKVRSSLLSQMQVMTEERSALPSFSFPSSIDDEGEPRVSSGQTHTQVSLFLDYCYCAALSLVFPRCSSQDSQSRVAHLLNAIGKNKKLEAESKRRVTTPSSPKIY
jgi:hypothetical protein